MTTTQKIEANKRNASKSTGPRSLEGKMRSANNARRHGLATRIDSDVDALAGINRLAAALAEGSKDLQRMEHARVVAECHFDLCRIRATKCRVLAKLGDLESRSSNDFESAAREIESINRYERRAFSKRKTGLRK